MLRCMRMAVGLALIVAMAGRETRAQWGYGGWGWGGWGASSFIGDARRGAAAFAMGAGVYNLDTAMANSINADTAMRWNDYVAQVTRESAFLHAARVHLEFLHDRSLYDAHQQKLRDNPSQHEIENGDALNAAVTDLSDPRLGSSALGAVSTPVPASLIAEVPFQNATERVTLMLDQLRNAFNWPEVFEGERFANDKKLFDDVITRMRKEDEEGDISPKTLQQARSLIQDLRAKVAAQPLPDPDDQRQAMRFINAYTALTNLLDKPDTRAALAELRKIKNTTLGNLLGFMHHFNLRFGPARTIKEREAYHQLYPILDQARDRILAEAKLPSLTTPRVISRNPALDFFQYHSPDFGRRGAQPQPAPQPPPPQNPQ